MKDTQKNEEKRIRTVIKRKKIQNEVEKMYVFNGYKFTEYIDMDFFKKKLKDELELEYKETDSLGDIYSNVVLQHSNKKIGLDKIFFECIMYNNLKHVFVNKFNEELKVELFQVRIKQLIENLNKKETIPLALHDFMNENGFYLMDSLNISSLTTKFIAGFDYQLKESVVTQARFLFTQVVPRGENPEYFIAGVDINFETKTYLIMIKSKTDIKKMEEEDKNKHLDSTIHSLYYRTKEMVTEKILATTKDIDVKRDRTAMYNLCKYLDNELLKDIRQEVKVKTENTIGINVTQYIDNLFNGEKKPSGQDKNDLKDNIQSLLIGIFVKTNFKSKQLVRKAKELKLLGYPTKIKFTSNRANRGSTQTSSAQHPVSATDMFHSLYISFRDALTLEQWSISWFTDFNFSNVKDIDVIQTTIYSKSTNLEVVFRPTRPLEKEIIYHVINSLNKYRENPPESNQ